MLCIRKMHLGDRLIMKILLSTALFIVQLTFFASSANAQAVQVFSFSGRNWPNNTLSNSYAFAGGNVGFAVTGSSNNALNALNDYNNSGIETPDIFVGTFGGLASNSTLILAMDQANTTRFVTNTITFSHTNGVRNVSFTMFDIDEGSYQDQITVTAWRNNVQLASSLVTISANNSTYTSGFGTNVARGINGGVSDTGANSGLANVTFQVDALTFIDRIDIRYGNGPTADSNPGQQWVMLSDISFVLAVPEPSTMFLLLGTPALAGSAWYLKNRKKIEKKAAQQDANPTAECEATPDPATIL